MKIFFRRIAFCVVVFLGATIYFFSPTGFSDETIRIVRPLDFPQETIFKQIQDNHLVRSQKTLRLLLSIIAPAREIEPGAYQLTHRMNLYQVVDTLLNHPYQKWVTLIPGLRKEQVSEILAKKFSWSDIQIKEFRTVAQEGYLFPDTYLLNVDYSPKEIYQRLFSNFNEKLDAHMQKDLLTQDERTDTAIKVASLIQRESGGDSDKALIAGIIWNRLNKKMALQIDATIQYALGKPGVWWPQVSAQDIKATDSPYNTYIYKGLPPGPIASPSLASIKAAIYPEETDCIFYLHDQNKDIHCAVTYEEHLKNIEKYLR